jgi:hypothetical protein
MCIRSLLHILSTIIISAVLPISHVLRPAHVSDIAKRTDTRLHRCRSIGYSSECLGLHIGQLHIANLGDGAGNRTEGLLARINFDWPSKVLLLLHCLFLVVH